MDFELLRKREYKTLDRKGHVYLDYTGGNLYPSSILKQHFSFLSRDILGNPHSVNPTSMLSTKIIKEVKHKTLSFFNANETEYCIIFTPNASGAIKLVGESFPFSSSSTLLLSADNHNSVHGIRAFAKHKSAKVDYIPLTNDLRMDKKTVLYFLEKAKRNSSNLFCYAAQSNFSGVQHSLDFVAKAQTAGWTVLLDASAFVPANKLDLSVYKPDFVSLSFYKMFGYPTGIGCLIAKRKSLQKLKRPWFSGGTIWAVGVGHQDHFFAKDDEGFEDGTVNYLGIPAVMYGLEFLQRIGIPNINNHTHCLTEKLLAEMKNKKHKNGKPLFVIYGPDTMEQRGSTVSFNFLTPEGEAVDERLVENAAAKMHISLRTGCFCNPGVGEKTFGIKKENLQEAYTKKHTDDYEDFLKILGMKTGGAIRISLGIASNRKDIDAFLRFSTSFLDKKKINTHNLRKREHC